MVEMFLKNIQQNAHMRTIMHILQLVRRKFINHDGIRLDVLHDVKTRNPDVARQDSVAARGFQKMVYQTSGRAFAFGA